MIQKGLAFRWQQSGSVARLDEAAWPCGWILPCRRESDTRWGEQSLYPTPGAAEFSDSGSSSASGVACTKASEAVLTITSSFGGCLNLMRGMEISTTSQLS